MTYLDTHVCVRGSVEVCVGPFGKSVLLETLVTSVVVEGELSFGLEESGLLHLWRTLKLINRYLKV